MKLQIVSVGQRMPQWVNQGVDEYLKRMPQSCSLSLRDIAMGKRGKQADIARLVREEGERMLKVIKPGSHVVALDVQGKSWSTQSVADKLGSWQGEIEHVYFLVGGPDGLSPDCLARADERWSLSKLTFPHPLVRVILAEQLYRGWRLLNGHPYHRE